MSIHSDLMASMITVTPIQDQADLIQTPCGIFDVLSLFFTPKPVSEVKPLSAVQASFSQGFQKLLGFVQRAFTKEKADVVAAVYKYEDAETVTQQEYADEDIERAKAKAFLFSSAEKGIKDALATENKNKIYAILGQVATKITDKDFTSLEGELGTSDLNASRVLELSKRIRGCDAIFKRVFPLLIEHGLLEDKDFEEMFESISTTLIEQGRLKELTGMNYCGELRGVAKTFLNDELKEAISKILAPKSTARVS